MRQNKLLTILSAEFFKLNKNRAIVISLLIPILILFFVDFYILYRSFDPTVSAPSSNPWKSLLGNYFFRFMSLLYSIVIAVYCHTCCDIEQKNDNYKLLFTLPFNRYKIYLSKIIYISVSILISTTLSYILFLLSGVVLGYLLPDYAFFDYEVRALFLAIFVKILIASFAVGFIQICLSLYFKSFIIPIALAAFMPIFCMIAIKENFTYFIPYTSFVNLINYLYYENTVLEKIDYYNLVYIFIFGLIGYFIFVNKKRVK